MKITRNLELRVSKEIYEKYEYKGFRMQQWYPVIGYDPMNEPESFCGDLIFIDDSDEMRWISTSHVEVRIDYD